MSSATRLLVVSAHAADFVWRSAGAIATVTQNGGTARVVALSYGERGESGELWKQAGQTEHGVKEIRRREAEAAAQILGAEFVPFDLGDYPLELDREALNRLTDEIRNFEPTVILTHAKADPFNPDHSTAYQVTERARQLASGAGVASAFKTIPPPEFLLFEPHQPELSGFTPNTFLDITPVFHMKVNAMEKMGAQNYLREYYSQRAGTSGEPRAPNLRTQRYSIRRGVRAGKPGCDLPGFREEAKMYQRFATRLAVMLLTAVACFGGQGTTALSRTGLADLKVATPVMDCSALLHAAIKMPADTPLQITGAAVVNESPASYCRVAGIVSPEVQIEVRLPLTTWTQRFVMTGCGGLCGNLNIHLGNDFACAPAQNGELALAATDMGHRGGMDASWADGASRARDRFRISQHSCNRYCSQIPDSDFLWPTGSVLIFRRLFGWRTRSAYGSRAISGRFRWHNRRRSGHELHYAKHLLSRLERGEESR